MNTQEINSFIENARKEHSATEAYLGFFYDDIHECTSYIKANKEGLILYASELLEASTEIDTKDFHIFSNDWNHFNSDFITRKIEYTKDSKFDIESKASEEDEQTWKTKLEGYIIISALLFILLSILVGAITIIRWLF